MPDVAHVADIHAPSTTVAILADTALAATFILREELTLTVNNGAGGGTYYTRDIVPIQADVPPGHRFSHWQGDTANVADPNTAETTVTMLADTEVTAVTVQQYELTVENGTGSGSSSHLGVTGSTACAMPIELGRSNSLWQWAMMSYSGPNSSRTFSKPVRILCRSWAESVVV